METGMTLQSVTGLVVALAARHRTPS